MSANSGLVGKALVHHIWQVHKSYSQLYSDPSNLAHHLDRASYNITQHVAAVSKNCQEQQLAAFAQRDRRLRETIFSNVDKVLQTTQRAAGRTFASLLQGLTVLDNATEGTINSQQGAVIYSYLQSFNTLLSAISTIVSHTILHTASDAQNSKSSEANERGVKKRIENIPTSITALLFAIISSLDSNHKSHKALFEGIMYLLLERVGTHLYLLTFNKERSATFEKDDGKIKGTLNYPGVTTEVKYLTQVLERAMSVAPTFLGSTLPISTNTKSTHPKSVASKLNAGQTKSKLALHAKEKLQRTLIHAMFGDNAAQNDFVERLKKPVAVEPVPLPPKIEDEDLPQWFREKIWDLVGWDILAREGNWW